MSGELAAALTALKGAADLGKALLGLHDAAQIQTKVLELNGQIIAAQASTLDAQAAQFALTEREHELKAEIAELKTWTAEREQYELVELHPGTFAFAKKPALRGSEPAHYLCANCFGDKRQSFLQRATKGTYYVLRCARCGAELQQEHIPVRMPAMTSGI